MLCHLLLLLSDHAVLWLRKCNRTDLSRAIASFPLLRNPRWSNSIGQYGLLSYFLEEKPMKFLAILKLLRINQKLEKLNYAAYHQVQDDLKVCLVSGSKKVRDVVFQAMQLTIMGTVDGLMLGDYRGVITTGILNFQEIPVLLFTTTMLELQQTVLVWHIATEICYYPDYDFFAQKKEMIRHNNSEIADKAQGMDEQFVLDRKMTRASRDT